MWKVILLLMAALPACAQSVSVERLQQTLAMLKAARTSDAKMARAINSLELTERLTNPALDRIKAEIKPGPKALLSLELLSYSSSFLDPPQTEFPQRAAPNADAEQSMMSAARSFAATTLTQLPDFIATRITRSFDNSAAAAAQLRPFSYEWQLMGNLSQEITYRGGKETVLAITSKKFESNEAETEPGLTSQGEFGPILATVLGDASSGKVTWSHWETTATGMAAVFHYQVSTSSSHYSVDFCCVRDNLPDAFRGNSYHGTPGYHGSLSVDSETGAILRVTFEAELDLSEPITNSSVAVEYGSVDIGGKNYICPLQSVAISSARSYLPKEDRDTTVLRLNEVVFTNYHRFGSSVRVLTDPPAN